MPKKEEIASVQMDKSDSEPIDTRKEVAKLAGVSAGTAVKELSVLCYLLIITIARTIRYFKKMLFCFNFLQIVLIYSIIQP